MTSRDEGGVVLRRRIRAAPETVFSFFTDHDRRLSWQGAEGSFDPRPGGAYRMRVVGDAVASGEFAELTPYRRIVFSWGWENEGDPVPPGSSRVEIDLTPVAEGTLLTLTHSQLPENARAPHEAGWEHYLSRLAVRAEGGDPGPDLWLQEAEEAEDND
ncbi:SRPBCC family protein [Streptacidiphilus rugosus]|uniref:SRPBCC family protein n=1 Tax=Streptacidiphilus rugosus TaxID=405783 RepID=UPI00055D0403|nr:SRPBCC family protein [Streptacidiphilus rugosus]